MEKPELRRGQSTEFLDKVFSSGHAQDMGQSITGVSSARSSRSQYRSRSAAFPLLWQKSQILPEMIARSQLFENTDKDKDGVISLEEFLQSNTDSVTGFVELLWPKLGVWLGEQFRTLLVTGIEQGLKDTPVLDGRLQVSQIELSDSAPLLGPIFCYRRSQGADYGIQLDMGLKWEAQAKLEIVLRPLTVGIKSIGLDGIISVLLRPLQHKNPVIGGLHVFFPTLPKITIHLSGLGGVASWSSIESRLRHFVEDLICGALVLPRRLAFRFDPNIADIPDFAFPVPRGLLRVRVLAARGLPGQAAISAVLNMGAASCSCHVRLGAIMRVTKSVAMKPDVVWADDEVLDFIVANERQRLSLHVWNGSFTSSYLCGVMSQESTICDMLAQQHDQSYGGNGGNGRDYGAWQNLVQPDDTGDANSAVRIHLQYLRIHPWGQPDPPPGVPCPSLSLLGLKILGMEGVPKELEQKTTLRLVMGSRSEVAVGMRFMSHTEHFAFSQEKIDIIWRLHNSLHLDLATIAGVVQESRETIAEVIGAVETDPEGRWLCQENLFMTITGEVSTVEAAVELRLGTRWVLLTTMPLADLLEPRKLQSLKPHAHSGFEEFQTVEGVTLHLIWRLWSSVALDESAALELFGLSDVSDHNSQ